MARTFFQHVVSMAAVLLTVRDPYNEPYSHPQVTHTSTDENGYPVIHVKADNYIDAAKPVEGTIYPGNVYREIVAKGGRDWEIRVQPFRTGDLEETKPRKTIERRYG